MATQVFMPQMGESVAEGTIVRWIKKVGETVERDEPLLEISTDKVDAEIPSPAAGVLKAIHVQEGETAAVNSVVAVIGDAGEATDAGEAGRHTVATKPAAAPLAAAQVSVASTTPANGSGRPLTTAEVRRQKSSPIVRKLAKEHSIDISRISGTGLEGRVTRDDLLDYIAKGPSAPSGVRPPVAPGAPVAPVAPVAPGDRVEPMSVMRKKIAEHMIVSRRTSAHVHTVFHVNFSAIEKLREARKAEYERAGAKLTYMAFVAKALVDAVRRHPILNASLDGDSIVYKKDVNLGIAVALDNGLLVPVIKNADQKTTMDLARSIADVANRARSKKLNPEEVQGGTITLTNPGNFGAQFAFPIINQPQVAILGMGTIEKRPIVIDDAIAIRTMCYLTLGFDHRLIDGAAADAFMADIKRQIETFDSKDM
jgi:pyruvate dehydrogenase E2 component (dihydrolipoamide acetyltransferase)